MDPLVAFQGYSRKLVMASLALLVLTTAGSGQQTSAESSEARLSQLEQDLVRLREENRRQRLENESQSYALQTLLSGQSPSGVPLAIPSAYRESTSDQGVPVGQGDEMSPFPSDTAQMHFRIQRLETNVDQLQDSLSVSLLDKEWSATVTGALIGEMIFSEQRPVIPSAIVLISPDFGRDTPTIDIHGKSSKIGVLFRGPDFLELQTGGALLAYLFGEEFLADTAGINLLGGYVELRSERWRFLFGRAGDLINPRQPGTIDINAGRNAGNLGFTRGQFRAERYLRPSRNTQITAQFALCNPITTAYDSILTNVVEDNGWPILEGRLVLGAGPVAKHFGVETRRFEIGTSGVLGQLRRTDPLDSRSLNVWLFGFDAKADLNKYCGVQAEFFHGQALGNLNGGILQIVNPDTLEEVRTIGGWGDFHINWTERLRSSIGFGIDNPLDSTLAPGQPTQNAFIFANLIWDITKSCEVGFEIAHWDTDYKPLPALGDNESGDNEAMIYRTRIVARF
jgi:hypothetical protein